MRRPLERAGGAQAVRAPVHGHVHRRRRQPTSAASRSTAPTSSTTRSSRRAVLSLAGELFVDSDGRGRRPTRSARGWIASPTLMPAIGAITVTPRSTFDDNQGRVFRLVDQRRGRARRHRRRLRSPRVPGACRRCIAHQTGGLYRDLAIEGIEDAADRRRAWMGALRRLVSRPDPGEAMNEAWHWA